MDVITFPYPYIRQTVSVKGAQAQSNMMCPCRILEQLSKKQWNCRILEQLNKKQWNIASVLIPFCKQIWFDQNMRGIDWI